MPVYLAEKIENENKHAALVNLYTEQRFAECHDCPLIDAADPFAYAACLRRTQLCLKDESEKILVCPNGFAPSAGSCVTADIGCKERYGERSWWAGESDNNGNYICACAEGYGWNAGRTHCVEIACPADMFYYSNYRTAGGEYLYGRCQYPDDACRSEYGGQSVFARRMADGEYWCACAAGYQWSADGGYCELAPVVRGFESPPFSEIIYAETVAREKELSRGHDGVLSRRLAGRILLQAEESGEAWYVDPIGLKRYFLGSPEQAFLAMKKFGLGATHEFTTGHETFPARVAGRILLDVGDSGRAYYIDPLDRRAFYLGRPADAFTIMREQALGITNADLRKIEVGEL